MVPEWRTATVAELQREGILLVEDGNHGEYRPRPDEFVDHGVAFVRAADMDGGIILFDSASRINDRARQRIRKGVGAPGDVLLSHKGTVGKVALVPDDAPSFVCSPQTTFWRTLNPRVLDRKYLCAFLRSPGFQAQLATRAGETDMAPYVSLTSQRGLSVLLPPIQEQHAIAGILGTLDGKIELGQQMNKTLEAIGQAVFRRWFVDFEFLNAEGKPYKSSGEEMVDSELGEIPKGWNVDFAIRLFELEYGWHLPEWDRKEGEIPVFGSGGLSGLHNSHFVDGPGIIIGRAGKIGSESVYYSHINFCPLETTFYVSINNKKYIRYLYFFIKTLSMINTGSSVPNLSRSYIHNTKILIPDEKIIENYDRIVEPLFELIYENSKQNESLSQIRDALLPKLMSGKIRVPVQNETVVTL